ncbi:hypothetical protein Barb7_00023 [Bacteroidales bacterium Barb7]|nr:hypothetical protein Barb7_00080 [Bacteroidales bacterium Barb7]OAV76309.1 hypothetical protein Barb7_00023 [Bacteroidales bacterium Barb7]
MNNISIYLKFLKERGRPLSEINPGSDETALSVSDALLALNILKDNQLIILGGDILSEDEQGKLVYVIHYWGYEYCYLDWYCNRINNESENEYKKRSYDIAKRSIAIADTIAKKLNKKCLISFVI